MNHYQNIIRSAPFEGLLRVSPTSIKIMIGSGQCPLCPVPFKISGTPTSREYGVHRSQPEAVIIRHCAFGYAETMVTMVVIKPSNRPPDGSILTPFSPWCAGPTTVYLGTLRHKNRDTRSKSILGVGPLTIVYKESRILDDYLISGTP